MPICWIFLIVKKPMDSILCVTHPEWVFEYLNVDYSLGMESGIIGMSNNENLLG